jgi:hypothetical protein
MARISDRLKVTLAAALLTAAGAVLPGAAQDRSSGLRIIWEEGNGRKITEAGNYARIVRTADGRLAAAFEDLRGNVAVSFSGDGEKWSGNTVVFPRFEENGVAVNAANAEICCLSDGTLVCGANYRPTAQGKVPYSIAVGVSRDGGQTWSEPRVIYSAGKVFGDGCWEPSFLELPDGTLQVYYANEGPYTSSEEQEISVLESRDGGLSWTSRPIRVSFRKGFRDGMPVAQIFGDEIVVAIEDNGGGSFQPYTVRTSLKDGWKKAVTGKSPKRDYALDDEIREGVYMGAPYIVRLPSGEAILSYQTDEDSGGGWARSVMEVAVGDGTARHFRNRSRPFDVPEGRSGLWNSLTVLDENTVLAVCSADLDGRGTAVWVKKGHLVRGAE